MASDQPWYIALATNRTVYWFCIALLLLTVYVLYLSPLGGDYDIWFHLRFGEHFVKDHTLQIDQGAFSWTPASSGWKYVTWIGSSLIYLAYHAASITGLYLLHYAIVLAAATCLLLLIRLLDDPLDLTYITGMALVLIAISSASGLLKPEMFTLLFIAVMLYWYVSIKLKGRNLFYLYPLLFLIWANTHGGFIIGLFFLSLALLGECINYLWLKRDPLPGNLLFHFGIALVLSYLAMLVNPYGMSYPVQLFNDLTDASYKQYTAGVAAYIPTWRFIAVQGSLPSKANLSTWALILMGILQLLASVRAYRKSRYFDPALAITSLAFFFISMKIARLGVFYPFVSFFSMALMVKKANMQELRRSFAPIALVIFAAFAGYAIFLGIFMAPQPPWQAIKTEELFPEREVKFIQEQKIPGPFFNDYLMGGYMLWALRDHKVFIDPRAWPFMDQVLPDYAFYLSDPSPERLSWLSSKYPFKSALIHISQHKLIVSFLRSPDWRLIYIDRMSCIFVQASVIDKLDPTAFRTDTEYFRNVKNPEVLYRLFNFLVTIDVDPRHAREIMHFYRDNVRTFYAPKKAVLQDMEKTLTEIEKDKADNGK